MLGYKYQLNRAAGRQLSNLQPPSTATSSELSPTPSEPCRSINRPSELCTGSAFQRRRGLKMLGVGIQLQFSQNGRFPPQNFVRKFFHRKIFQQARRNQSGAVASSPATTLLPHSSLPSPPSFLSVFFQSFPHLFAPRFRELLVFTINTARMSGKCCQLLQCGPENTFYAI